MIGIGNYVSDGGLGDRASSEAWYRRFMGLDRSRGRGNWLQRLLFGTGKPMAAPGASFVSPGVVYSASPAGPVMNFGKWLAPSTGGGAMVIHGPAYSASPVGPMVYSASPVGYGGLGATGNCGIRFPFSAAKREACRRGEEVSIGPMGWLGRILGVAALGPAALGPEVFGTAMLTGAPFVVGGMLKKKLKKKVIGGPSFVSPGGGAVYSASPAGPVSLIPGASIAPADMSPLTDEERAAEAAAAPGGVMGIVGAIPWWGWAAAAAGAYFLFFRRSGGLQTNPKVSGGRLDREGWIKRHGGSWISAGGLRGYSKPRKSSVVKAYHSIYDEPWKTIPKKNPRRRRRARRRR